jgi:hypothetical protein
LITMPKVSGPHIVWRWMERKPHKGMYMFPWMIFPRKQLQFSAQVYTYLQQPNRMML